MQYFLALILLAVSCDMTSSYEWESTTVPYSEFVDSTDTDSLSEE